MFKKEFIQEAMVLYPGFTDLHRAIENGSGAIGRYLDDNAPSGIGYSEILAAESLGELQEKAMIIKRKNDLYRSYMSGSCYETEEDRRERIGCPRLYAQNTMDEDALNEFKCYGVFVIPNCPKFKTGECWKRFDEIGLKMKE